MRSILQLGALIGALSALAACSAGTVSTTPPAAPLGGYTQDQSSAVDGGVSDYKLPANVQRACGLDIGPDEARCYALIRTDIPGGAQPDINGYAPADLQQAYNLPSSTMGSGQTVAIVDAWDNPNSEADLAVYRSQWGLPACTTANGCYQKVNQLGQPSPLPSPPPASKGSWVVEESLDVDMVSASCPNCHIILLEGNSNTFHDLSQAEDHAVRMGANMVSNSYGAPTKLALDHIARQYDHPGHIILASAGDAGFGAAIPAGFSSVVSVGGTSLHRASGSRGFTETTWHGTGSGCSKRHPQPKWQNNQGDCKGRAENDVASVSDPATGVAVYDTYHAGGWIVVGGTSAASPFIAGIYGLAGNASKLDAAESLYAKGASLWDITTGTNGTCMKALLCTAGPGWDGPTGNGTPNGISAF